MIIQSIFLYVWQNKVTHYYFGGSLKSTRKMVAVSLVSFQANQNVQCVQLTFDKNSSYKNTVQKDFLNFFTLFRNCGMSHKQRSIPFKCKFEEEKPPKNMLFFSIEPSFSSSNEKCSKKQVLESIKKQQQERQQQFSPNKDTLFCHEVSLFPRFTMAFAQSCPSHQPLLERNIWNV